MMNVESGSCMAMPEDRGSSAIYAKVMMTALWALSVSPSKTTMRSVGHRADGAALRTLNASTYRVVTKAVSQLVAVAPMKLLGLSTMAITATARLNAGTT